HRDLKFLNNLQPEWSRHVTIVHETKDLHTADYTQLYDFLKYNQKEVDELKAKRLAKIQDPLALMANSNNPYASTAPHQDLSPFNQNYMQQPIPNPEDITMIGGNGGNQFRQYAGQNAGNLNGYNAAHNVRNQVAQNLRVQNVGNQNGLMDVQGNGNLVAVRAEAKEKGCCLSSDTVVDCSDGRGRNPTLSRRQASSSGTQTDSTPIYDSNGSAEVHEYANCYNNEIFNMFTQEEQYT
nr:hypothetical protein [Tanacetum cinerariifolium]